MLITSTRAKQKGFVLLVMGASAVALLGALGLAVDMGRMFIVRNETQAFCDSAALTGASLLNGSSEGVQQADTAAKATAINWNFNTTALTAASTCASGNICVTYSTSTSGTWSSATSFPTGTGNAGNGCDNSKSSNNDPACSYRFIRVQTKVSLPLYFLPVVQPASTRYYNQTINSQAIAGQVDISNGVPAAPYTGVAEGCYTGVGGAACPNGIPTVSAPYFGLTPGTTTAACTSPTTQGNGNNQTVTSVGCYDIQWPKFNGTASKCTSSGKGMDNCFISSPCPNDTGGTEAEYMVVNNWASSFNGYWGAQAASSIEAEVIDLLNVNGTVTSPGTNIYSVMTNGQQQTQAKALDDRVNQDGDNYDAVYATYLANPLHNGRRLMLAPVVAPISGTATVVQGYGNYFLISDQTAAGGTSQYYKKNTNGNAPYCALYVGPGCVGCSGGGVGGTTGAAIIALVQ